MSTHVAQWWDKVHQTMGHMPRTDFEMEAVLQSFAKFIAEAPDKEGMDEPVGAESRSDKEFVTEFSRWLSDNQRPRDRDTFTGQGDEWTVDAIRYGMSMPSRPSPSRWTEEEIERMGEEYRKSLTGTSVEMIAPSMVAAYNTALRFANTHLSTGLGLDATMTVVQSEVNEYCSDCVHHNNLPVNRVGLFERIRARLTSLKA